MIIAGMRLMVTIPLQFKVRARIITMPTGTGLEAVGQMYMAKVIILM